jgi:hypothetical protein
MSYKIDFLLPSSLKRIGTVPKLVPLFKLIRMSNNQLDALYIFTLLSHHTSTCFERIGSPASGGILHIRIRIMYTYVANGSSELTVSGLGQVG